MDLAGSSGVGSALVVGVAFRLAPRSRDGSAKTREENIARRLPVLGELEAEVMTAVWELGAVTVKDVAARLVRERAYNTVQTTLERLLRKDFLMRDKQSHAFVYSPRVSRAEYHQQLLSSVVGGLLSENREPVLAAFVEVAGDADLKNLERLESLIAAKRKAERTRK